MFRSIRSVYRELDLDYLRVGLRTLKRHAESTIPDELGDDTERARHTEQDGVEVLLGKTVVGEENAGMGVDVRPRVLGLAHLEKNGGDDGVQLADELEQFVLRQVLQGELALSLVARVGLANCTSKAGKKERLLLCQDPVFVGVLTTYGRRDRTGG